MMHRDQEIDFDVPEISRPPPPLAETLIDEEEESVYFTPPAHIGSDL